ncbi:MAG: hypothetical protein R6U51_06695 [Anaerolineales bacterium]
MKKIIILLALVFSFSTLVSTASADGSIHAYIEGTWEVFNETQQECVINFHEGHQGMILSVETGQRLRGEKAVWIFPVPAAPEKTDVNILEGFPELDGYNVEERAKQNLSDVFNIMRSTQIYPLPFQLIEAPMMLPMGPTAIRQPGRKGVTVHERVEKLGSTTELVSAEDGSSLRGYITQKGLTLPAASQNILEEYIGQEYSFVMSWISNSSKIESYEKEQTIPYLIGLLDQGKLDEAKAFIKASDEDEQDINLILNILNDTTESIVDKKQNIKQFFPYQPREDRNKLGVFLSFPTQKIFYPLKPTSVYGNDTVPAVIYILDYVKPEVYREIKSDTEVSYFYANQLTLREAMEDIFTGFEKVSGMFNFGNETTAGFQVREVRYTKINIDTASKHFTEDLWIEVATPLRVRMAHAASKFQLVYGPLLFAISSCAASLLSGMILFRDRAITRWKFVAFGLSNSLSIIGFTIAAYLLNVDTRFTDTQEVQQNEVSARNIFLRTTLSALGAAGVLSMLLSLLFNGSFPRLLLALSATFFVIGALITSIIWALKANKKVFKFCLLFSVLFVTITVLLQVFMNAAV